MKNLTFILFLLCFSIIVKEAIASDVDLSSYGQIKPTTKYEYRIDGKSIFSFGKPEAFEGCKIEKGKDGKTGFALDFIQDILNKQLQITNNTDQPIGIVRIYYKKALGAFEQSYNIPVFLEPNSNKVFDMTALSMMYEDRVSSIVGSSPKIVDCIEKYSSEEIQLQRESHRTANEDLANQKAEQRKARLHRQIIFDNCMADKLPTTNNRKLTSSVTSICKRISASPNWWHRFWYAD